ncbi:response regulator transcription factor [Pseudogracilibacillus sp. SO30301A]|uniref:response regulator transcription factor n=1 Tax=Pseudogracilibacillus sp. SO30301A TaxID=3098291 RepID=UPI00300DDA8B
MTIKVLLVDDHQVVLQGLKFFLNTQSDIEIVGEANNGRKALEAIEQLKPDIVLMDLVMPVMDGVEATRKINELYPAIKVIVLTSFSEQNHVLPALRAGAVAYQLKDIEPDELVNTIHSAFRGEKQLHPKATNLLLSHMTDDTHVIDELNLASLSPREMDVLYHISLGKSNKQIACELCITEKTVKTHVSSILSKLELDDRTQAAIFALKNNIFDHKKNS